MPTRKEKKDKHASTRCLTAAGAAPPRSRRPIGPMRPPSRDLLPRSDAQEARLRARGAEQHGRAGRRLRRPMGRGRAAAVSPEPLHPAPERAPPLGGGARAPPRRRRRQQDLRRGPRHGLRPRDPLLRVLGSEAAAGDRSGAVRGRRDQDRGVGAGHGAVRWLGAAGEGGGGEAGSGAVVPGGERYGVPRGRGGVQGTDGEAGTASPVGSRDAGASLDSGAFHGHLAVQFHLNG